MLGTRTLRIDNIVQHVPLTDCDPIKQGTEYTRWSAIDVRQKNDTNDARATKCIADMLARKYITDFELEFRNISLTDTIHLLQQ